MKSIFLALIVLSLVGCKIVSCPTAERIASGAAAGIAKAAACKNLQAIHDDLLKALGGEACSSPAPTGPIALFACPILSKFVADAAFKRVPAAWQCEGGNAKLAIQSALTFGCEFLPF